VALGGEDGAALRLCLRRWLPPDGRPCWRSAPRVLCQAVQASVRPSSSPYPVRPEMELDLPHALRLHMTWRESGNWPGIKANEEAKKISRDQSSTVLPMHLLGPTPTNLGSAFGAGPGASVGATDPGRVDLTMHRHKIKIGTPEQETKRLEEPTSRS